MLYLVVYDFRDKEKRPNEEFFTLIESLGQADYCLENSILLDAAYLAKGILDEIRTYMEQNNGHIVVCRVTKDFAAMIRENSRKYLKRRWDRVPDIDDLGKLPKRDPTNK